MLIQLGSAPVLAGIFYIYIRDKYEKEPKAMVALTFLFGIYTTFIIFGVGRGMELLFPHEETPFYTAFVSSSGVEELVKFVFLYILIWKNKNFNEPLDGIVYGVFLSLGFAWIENLIYVLHPTLGGMGTGLARAVLSVPSHGLFGVQMGYYLGLIKFKKTKFNFVLAFIVPYLFHGFYNYFLLKELPIFWIPFWILQGLLWYLSLKYIKTMLNMSPFRH